MFLRQPYSSLLPRALRRAWLAIGLSGALLAAARADDVVETRLPPASQKQIDFGRDVYPILKENCFDCHEGRNPVSAYRLDSRPDLLGETNGVPLAVSGHSAKSRLVLLAARVLPDKQMPPKDEGHPLSAEQVGILRAWIDQGVNWDNELLPPPDKVEHWAFRPVRRPALPDVKNTSWARTPVDAFIAARHEAMGLSPANEAERRTLIRRLSLDLVGMPPAPEEVEVFVADASPDAYEQLVERLLASPRYGQRWGRHWLDVARWAETEGYESNHPRPYAWRYRDYVVDSFNSDKPFDQFLREQIAGDEIEPYSDEQLIATGFLAGARLSSNEEDKQLQDYAVHVDIVNATTSAVLGLTMACAQCHSHKLEPLSQRDYYALMAFFVGGRINNLVLQDEKLWAHYDATKPPELEPARQLRDLLFEKAKQKTIADLRQKLPPEMRAALDVPEGERTREQQELARQADLKLQLTPDGIRSRMSADDKQLYAQLQKKIDELQKAGRGPGPFDVPQTWGFYSPATSPHHVQVLPMVGFYPPDYDIEALRRARSYIRVRGQVHRRGPAVAPAWPAVLGQVSAAARERMKTRPRSALVDWLVDPENPLTARVWVNRVWQHHFGRGIVATADDFGVHGQPPTHRELLDYLASELMESGWSTKHTHRLIALSSAYRQGAAHDANDAALDPDNLLLWRFEPRRLEAEAIRDSALAASGLIDNRFGGRGEVAAEQPASMPYYPAAPAGKHTARRSLYWFQSRDRFPAMQQLFDGPSTNESCARRHATTVALQPLHLLNNAEMLEIARAFATRVEGMAGDDVEAQIDMAFRLALCRPPDDDERAAAREFLGDPAAAGSLVPDGDEDGADGARDLPLEAPEPAGASQPPSRLVQFCHALLNLNEFVYMD